MVLYVRAIPFCDLCSVSLSANNENNSGNSEPSEQCERRRFRHRDRNGSDSNPRCPAWTERSQKSPTIDVVSEYAIRCTSNVQRGGIIVHKVRKTGYRTTGEIAECPSCSCRSMQSTSISVSEHIVTVREEMHIGNVGRGQECRDDPGRCIYTPDSPSAVAFGGEQITIRHEL